MNGRQNPGISRFPSSPRGRGVWRRRFPGFTVIELLVVVLILGILALIAVPGYQKSVENSYADQAVSTVQIIGTTNRLYNLDQTTYTKGLLNTCTPEDCNTALGTHPAWPCNLISCQYMAMQNFSQAEYNFCTMDGTVKQTDTCGMQGGSSPPPSDYYVACAIRIQCGAAAPACNGTAGGNGTNSHCSSNTTYQNWGYTVDVNGVIHEWNGAPKPPS